MTILPQSNDVQLTLIGKSNDINIKRVNPALYTIKARNTTTSFGGVDDDPDCDLAELSRILWNPVAQHVDSYKSIFLSPVLDLVHLPFEILPVQSLNSMLLCDQHTFSYVSCGRDILRLTTVNAKGPPMVIANPNYSLHVPQNKQPSTPVTMRHGIKERFSPLPGAEKEGRLCGALLNTTPIMWNDAIVGVVKKCQFPSVLHIASHGSYNGGNPLIAFAGVNSYQEGKPIPYDAENGILYAQDAALLSLQGSIVVLSACETGICDINWADSAIGLRGRLLSAGAACNVVSLCPVDDVITERFMTMMYTSLIKDRTTVEVAVKAARDVLRNEGLPPLVWSAFVVVGNGDIRLHTSE